jgi:hypothetical protein
MLIKASEVEDSPALVKLYENYLRNDEERFQEELEKLRKKEENATVKLLESQAKWTSFAKDILSVCKELLKAIHTLKANNPVPVDFLEMSEARIKKYEVFLNESEATFSSNDNRISPEQTQGLSNIQDVKAGASIAFLDCTKVKEFLGSSSDDVKICGLLQILKRRLLQTCRRKYRKQTMEWFINYDILDCRNSNGNILGKLLTHHGKKYFFHKQ